MLYTELLYGGALAVLMPVVSAANPFCKGGAPAVVASVLTDFPPAVSYCSSVFPLPKVSSTSTAPITTVTTTVATQSPLVTVATVTNTLIATITLTDTAVTTTISTTTATVVSVIQQKRDAVDLVGRANPKAAAQWSSVQKQAKSLVASICTCLETPVTVYATTTPSTTISATDTSPVSVTLTATATATATATITATTMTTTTFSITATTTTTTTSTSTVVTTVTQTLAYRGPPCNLAGGSTGCSSNCFCDPRVPGGQVFGVCDTAIQCGGGRPPCSSDADCRAGEACANPCGAGTQCVPFTACTSSFVPAQAKRGLELELFSRRVSPLVRRDESVEVARLAACRRRGILPRDCKS
ncbi:hypothetical protein OPT61_g6760 [Boeremia exigua]|uniref:Uncharacterized protein n=1 Tax=Boeremia exigua TaxID=749465 RepID=A0ACC2I5V5_9PLEO|nr:hypothetical protein OPT61_g6760 [Boeremia exigua]